MQGKERKRAITAHCCCLLALELQCQWKGFVSQLLIVSYGNYNTGILKERQIDGHSVKLSLEEWLLNTLMA